MKTTTEIHDMIQTTVAGDTDRILDILLEMNALIAQEQARLNRLFRERAYAEEYAE